MKVPMLHTKVTLPRRRNEILSRERLNALFDELLDYRLIIVTAPAGYGKTSLLVDIAHQHELPFCWYTLDLLDQDAHRFLSHLIAAIQQTFPDFGIQSQSALQAADKGELPLDHLLTVIVNEMYRTIREHFVIVLDDYHLVDEEEEINVLLNRFVQDVDENCHIVILSRALLPLEDLPLMVARSQVGGLGFQELAFSTDEIQQLMEQNYHQAMPRSVAELLAEKTEGWITGLLLSAHNLWQGMTDRLRVARVSGVGLYDYLAREVLGGQAPELRDLMLRTSLLEEFDANLCEAILGKPPAKLSWQDMMDEISRYNLFVLPVGRDGRWLRYHLLFRDFLQDTFKREQPEEAKHMLRIMANVYSDRGEWEKAYDACQRLTDETALADLLENIGDLMVYHGRMSLLLKWLEQLPAELLNARPSLLADKGIAAATQGRTQEGLVLLDQAVDALGPNPPVRRYTGFLLWRALVHHIRGTSAKSLEDAHNVLILAANDEKMENVRAEALRIIGLNSRLAGRVDESIESLHESLEIFKKIGDQPSVTRLSLDLGAAYLAAGEFNTALQSYQVAKKDYLDQGNTFALAAVLNDLAFLHHLLGQLQLAGTTYEQTLDLARNSGNRRVEAIALAGLGDLYMDLEVPQSALSAYQRCRDIVQTIQDHFLTVYLDLAEAGAERAIGETDLASHLLDRAGENLAQRPLIYAQGLHALETGRFYLALNKPKEASQAFIKAVSLFRDSGQQVELAKAELLCAWTLHLIDEKLASLKHLAGSLEVTNQLKSPKFLVPTAQIAVPLLKHTSSLGNWNVDSGTEWDTDQAARLAQEAQQLVDQTDRFINEKVSLRRILRRSKGTVPLHPSKLRIRALGFSQVSINGRIVQSADWQAQVTRDLFFLLLTRREGFSKEAIGEALWPDSSPAQLRLRFKNTIYRLRRAAGQDSVLLEDNRYIFNWVLDYDYDVEVFEELLARAIQASDLQEKQAAYRDAITAYQGLYLPDVGGTWVVSERERLRQNYITASLELAKIDLDAAEFHDALETTDRLITEDPCLEEAYRIAMRIHAAAGNRAAIAYQYQNLCQALYSEIGAQPSPQTEALYNSLMG